MHISIAGKLGSGKSTICNILKARHGFQIYSTGAIQREIALKNNVSTLEMNQLMAQDLNYDHAIDNAVTELSIERSNETIVFDSRMAWNFASNSFKVFVAVDPLVAAERVISNPRGIEEVYIDLEDAKSKLIERSKLENERYISIYGVNNFDYSNYNLVIDSTYASPEDITDIIYNRFQSYCNLNTETHDILLSPKSLFPLERIANISTGTLSEDKQKKEYLRSLISVATLDGYHYIVDGHDRALAAILNSEKFISVSPADVNSYPFLKSTETLVSAIQATGVSSVYDFEEAGKFKYKSYPRYYS